MTDKKKKSKKGLLTGLIVGGAVVSVASVLIANRNKKLPGNLQAQKEETGIFKKILRKLFR